MAIDLGKNKDALVAAWSSVVDDKSPINWAVYSYEGQSNILKVVNTGKGGLLEMIDELNSGMIMYAFCRVIDIKTTLPKCLLINWQGEGAPIVRKGTCANHIRDIEKLLKGAHITISARSEEDVEVDLIMEKLSRATASSYKFNEPRGQNGDRGSGPVGTIYNRVIPAKEINASERDQFWQKEEIEEKKRLEQERDRLEQSRRKMEEEVKKREEVESRLRDQKVVAKEDIIAKQRQAEQRAEEIKNLRNQKCATINAADSDEEPKSRSDELRKERNREAQELIAQRTINARAIFEQNSSAGQTKSQKISHSKGNTVGAARKMFEQSQLDQNKPKEQIKTEQMRNTKPKEMPEVHQEVLPQAQSEPQLQLSNQEQSKEQLLPQTLVEPRAQITVPQRNEINIKEESLLPLKENSIIDNGIKLSNESKTNNAQITRDVHEVQQMSVDNLEEAENELYGQLETGQYLYLDPNNQGMKARALYDYQAADETEITFDPGDVITHIDAIDEGWWQGLAPDGTYGLFPANHVEVIDYGST
ncbi:hypothetical protein QAD02_000391 [Eretmocerus hayati]|uniref:Uncharacterized protein n=1 Tax=Eretmocerus hayati TaxID=131215 RepID=A0ACC2NFW8_9HYME|nr:hypothetical protein QAD02_000391 [Eretmocerus hayati]